MKYGNKTLRRRGKGDNWEAAFYYRDPRTGERKVIYRRFQAKTRKTAESIRDEIRYQLELGGKLDESTATVKELMESYVDYKEASGTVEEATEMIAEKSGVTIPRDDTLLAQEPTQEPSMAMQLLLSDGYDKMDDADKLALMGLIRKYS